MFSTLSQSAGRPFGSSVVDVTLSDDEALLDNIERTAFSYFRQVVNPANGLVADNTRDGSPCSIAVQNALFHGRRRLSALTIPWCTYTGPEIAHVGIYVRQAREQGISVRTFTIPLREVDRAIADGEEAGFVKIHVKGHTDQILGATIVASHAGEMISEITLAIVSGVGLRKLASVIHPYPTQAGAIGQAADAYELTRVAPHALRRVSAVLHWLRG